MFAGCALAQSVEPAHWSAQADTPAAAPGGKALVRVTASVDAGWHLYAASSPSGIPASFKVGPGTAVERVRVLQPPPRKIFDQTANANAEIFENQAAFLLEVALRKDAPTGAAELTLAARFQVCSDTRCVPGRWTGTVALRIDPAASAAAPAIPAGYREAVAPTAQADSGWAAFVLVAFGFGLASVFTPCVFPMIPITLSYFLNRPSSGQRSGVTQAVDGGRGGAATQAADSGPRGAMTQAADSGRGGAATQAVDSGQRGAVTQAADGGRGGAATQAVASGQRGGVTQAVDSGRPGAVMQAVVFCLGIVVLFTGLGLATSAALGPAGVKNLGSSPWVNGFIAALFIAFGLSLLGAFEIAIPSPILTRLSRSSNAGGFIGTLLMGLAFALSSFACVGPFVGTLLAGSVQLGALRPLVGMAAFSAGLALPFFLLALFPSLLLRLPKSGGWLVRVKIVMGFAILAFSLKYLAGLDQTLQWGLLPRERFLAIWVVLFAMAGAYLLGFLRLEGVKPDEPLGLGRLLTAAGLLAFALSLVPGMLGGNLGSLEAFVPMAGNPSPGALVWMKDQYREALDRARREGKLVFVDFTGYNCANCHWMRGNVLNRPEIVAELQGFVLLELYTDGTDAASAANSKLQQEKFGTVSEPFYAIFDPDERPIAKFDGLTHDAVAFLAFLKTRPDPATASAIGPFDPAVLAGKPAVLNFWATYCVPCIAELPAFNRVYRDLGPKGVAMVGIAMDEDPTGVPAFLKRHPIDYPVAMGSADTWKKYKIDGLPVTLVLNRAGDVVQRFDSGTPESGLRAAVEKALR